MVMVIQRVTIQFRRTLQDRLNRIPFCESRRVLVPTARVFAETGLGLRVVMEGDGRIHLFYLFQDFMQEAHLGFAWDEVVKHVEIHKRGAAIGGRDAVFVFVLAEHLRQNVNGRREAQPNTEHTGCCKTTPLPFAFQTDGTVEHRR